MKRETITLERHITVGETVVFPVIQTSVNCQNYDKNMVCFGQKSLIAVVSISPDQQFALNAIGESISIQQYADQFPEIKELMDRYR
jgi:hypothetical protein